MKVKRSALHYASEQRGKPGCFLNSQLAVPQICTSNCSLEINIICNVIFYLTLFDVSTCNSADIHCTGISYRYITVLWVPFCQKRRAPLTFFMSMYPCVYFGEAHSGRISLNLVFETFIKTSWGKTCLIKIVHKIQGNLLEDQYASSTVIGYIKSP